MPGLDIQRGLNDGPGLHGGDGQAATPVAHHGVELVEGGDDGLDVGNGLAHILGQQLDVSLVGGQELVQRGVQEADGDGAALHGLVDALKVGLLHGLQLAEGFLPLLHIVRTDHLPDGGDAVLVKEHVLGPAQADALSAELPGLGGVVGGVGIGADLETAIFVGPAHDPAELAADGGVHRGDGPGIDAAGGAIQGDPVALFVGLAGEDELLVFLVHLDVAAARDTTLAHAPGHHGGVGGHAAANGQDALGGLHALDVLGRGLQTHQDHLLAPLSPGLGVLSGEDDLAGGSAGGGAQRLADGLALFQGHGVELGMEQGVQRAGLDHGNSLLLRDLALIHQITGDLQRGGGGALAVAGLEHIELVVLHSELHILHIVIVILQNFAHILELGESGGELLGHLADRHGSPHAGHHVLALGVGQKFTEELLLAE